ncbi:hypothetical protein FB388_0844 [Pseudonocardia cypriaca]|uniref:Uncharacterized protein n=1 Tax=Pseudonocardia cypriaca TaxID=882449 RepID=A0A543GBN3_9PSEU|nr:hypothetical protein FB388_0844 [Pseudonocardia cypriaca]
MKILFRVNRDSFRRGSLHPVRASVAGPTGRGNVDRVEMTVRSATLVRTALAGAVVCLIAVGVTAPALAGGGDGEGSCAGVGPVDVLLQGRACTEEEPAERAAPGSLLNPQFPDFPDFPGLDDEDDQDDESDDASDEDPDERDSDSEDSASSEDREDGDDDAAEGAAAAGTGSDGGSDDETSDAAGGETAGEEAAPAAPAPAARARKAPAAESGADAAVGAAVLPGVGSAVDREKSPGLDWTGALTPRRPAAPQEPPLPGPAHNAPSLPPVPPAPPAAPEHTADLAAVAFATSFPSPIEARWNPGAVLPSLVLTLLLLAALALPVGRLNRAAAEQPDRIEAMLARLRVPPGAAGSAPGVFLTAVAITAVAGAVMLGFLTPEFPFDNSAPAMLAGLAVAFVLVTAAQQGTQLLYVARWWGVRCHVGPVPGFLLLGAVGLVLSRAMGLEPGLVLGTLVAFRSARPLRTDEEGPAVALAATALTALGGAAWIVREPLVAAAGAPGTFLADVVATALTATAVSAAANLLFALVPLSFLPGAALLRWSPALWALFACTGGFAFVHLAVRPAADALAGRAGALAVLLGVYLVVAAGLWTWLRFGAGWSVPQLSRASRQNG